MDELLAAIAPDTTVTLEPGTYDLTTASDYGVPGEKEYYRWDECWDGFELVLLGTDGLNLVGESPDAVTICTGPRYAEVLRFGACEDISLTGLTLGHTEEASTCEGGVLCLESVTDAEIDNCVLYGCGILGITAQSCEGIRVDNTDIKECSDGAVLATGCWDFVFDECRFFSCGMKGSGWSLFQVNSCCGFAVVNSEITGNFVIHSLLTARYSSDVRFLGSRISGNVADEAAFVLTSASPVFEGCAFTDNVIPVWYASEDGESAPVTAAQEIIDDFTAMTWAESDFAGFDYELTEPELDVTEKDGRRYVTVSTVDEFLAAIAPDTTITMEEGEYLLGDAAWYGTIGGDYYRWELGYDGPILLIEGADGLTIQGAGTHKTTILTEPRGSSILRFESCDDLTVSGFTAGHTEGESGGCGAGVLYFADCAGTKISECGLFGCGTQGFFATECSDMFIVDTEIYDCSVNVATISLCDGVAFENCGLHDCGTDDRIDVYDSENVTLDGEAIQSMSDR